MRANRSGKVWRYWFRIFSASAEKHRSPLRDGVKPSALVRTASGQKGSGSS